MSPFKKPASDQNSASLQNRLQQARRLVGFRNSSSSDGRSLLDIKVPRRGRDLRVPNGYLYGRLESLDAQGWGTIDPFSSSSPYVPAHFAKEVDAILHYAVVDRIIVWQCPLRQSRWHRVGDILHFKASLVVPEDIVQASTVLNLTLRNPLEYPNPARRNSEGNSQSIALCAVVLQIPVAGQSMSGTLIVKPASFLRNRLTELGSFLDSTAQADLQDNYEGRCFSWPYADAISGTLDGDIVLCTIPAMSGPMAPASNVVNMSLKARQFPVRQAKQQPLRSDLREEQENAPAIQHDGVTRERVIYARQKPPEPSVLGTNFNHSHRSASPMLRSSSACRYGRYPSESVAGKDYRVRRVSPVQRCYLKSEYRTDGGVQVRHYKRCD